MKLLWCFVFLAIALVEGKSVLHNVPQEYVQSILKAAADCSNAPETGHDAVQKLISANLENSEPFKKFLYCFSIKSGYVDNDGHFIVDKMTKLIGNHKNKSKFIDALNLCNEIKSVNAHETMFKTAVCFKDTSPIYFTI